MTPRRDPPDAASPRVKGALLAALVVQNAALNIAARRTRVAAGKNRRTNGDDDDKKCEFSNLSAVVVIEALKFGVAWALAIAEGTGSDVVGVVAARPLECVKICVPALLYTATNNLVLVAADFLEGPLLALFSQTKILATGLFAKALLGRTVGPRRWAALALLTLSVGVVQFDSAAKTEKNKVRGDGGRQSVHLGLLVVTAACAVSAFAGTYLELVLKDATVSLWVRNVHLAAFSVAVGLGGYVANNNTENDCGFFGGWSRTAWVYVAVQTLGGLLIGAVIKHADNVVKNFATALAILVIALVSAAFYGFDLSGFFFVGAAGVVASILLYADLLGTRHLLRLLPRRTCETTTAWRKIRADAQRGPTTSSNTELSPFEIDGSEKHGCGESPRRCCSLMSSTSTRGATATQRSSRDDSAGESAGAERPKVA